MDSKCRARMRGRIEELTSKADEKANLKKRFEERWTLISGLISDQEERSLLFEIQLDPDNEESRLAYAAWLDARADARAYVIRFEINQGRMTKNMIPFPWGNLNSNFDAQLGSWIDLMRRDLRIVNCGQALEMAPRIRFEYRCSKTWESLNDTGNPEVRSCDGCRQKVFLCSSIEAAEHHARQGQCIAISEKATDTAERSTESVLDDLVVGFPKKPLERWADRLFGELKDAFRVVASPSACKIVDQEARERFLVEGAQCALHSGVKRNVITRDPFTRIIVFTSFSESKIHLFSDEDFPNGLDRDPSDLGATEI